MKIFVRLLEFAARFAIGVNNFGLRGALKVFILLRSRSPAEPASIHLKQPNRRFYFRGASDWGVVGHFYKPGYRIVDNGTSGAVRYIVDAGANIGDETVRFRYFHPEATIIALEPDAGNFRLLTRNAQSDPKIICLNKGLWSKECRLKVIAGTVNENFTVIEVTDPGDEYDTEAVSVGRLMRDFDIPEIDILKMDIEGAEREVFDAESATGWISKVKVLILECPDNDSPGTAMLIFDKLLQRRHNFNCYIHGENLVLIRGDVSWTLASDVFFDA